MAMMVLVVMVMDRAGLRLRQDRGGKGTRLAAGDQQSRDDQHPFEPR